MFTLYPDDQSFPVSVDVKFPSNKGSEQVKTFVMDCVFVSDEKLQELVDLQDDFKLLDHVIKDMRDIHDHSGEAIEYSAGLLRKLCNNRRLRTAMVRAYVDFHYGGKEELQAKN